MLSILLMDGSGAHSDSVAALLRDRGHSVRRAPNPIQALAFGREHGPDVALLEWDWAAYEMLSLIESLGGAATTRQTRIMCMVRTPGAEEHYRAVELGAHDILAMPVAEHDLLLRCAAVTRRERDVERSMVVGPRPLITMCAGCNKIRDDEERWVRVEAHLAREYGIDVSHGYCPPCARHAFETITR